MEEKGPKNKMKEIKIEKLTLNICAGIDEAKLNKAIKLLEVISGKKPVKTLSKKRIPAFKIRPGLPIGCKVTMRGKGSKALLGRLFEALENKIDKKRIGEGTLTFGIAEYIQIPEVGYQRDIGIMGLDAAVTLMRPGFRVMRKKIKKGEVPKRHRINKAETKEFFEKNFKVVFEKEKK